MLEIQSVSHAMNILSLFSSTDPELGVSEISRRLKMSKSSVARLLYTLELSGALIKSETNQKYQIGYQVVQMNEIFKSNNMIVKTAMPYMSELRKNVNETIDLSVLYQNRRILLERIKGDNEVPAKDTLGRPSLLQAGASGKLFLAYLPEDRREKLLNDMELIRFTSKTIINRQELRQQLEIIRIQGYACSYEELTELINAVAVPIRDKSGEVMAALSIWGFIMQFSREVMIEYTPLLIGIANRISTDLGYRG
jgi:IclR family transcriptional regulator, KDG regulon repressor